MRGSKASPLLSRYCQHAAEFGKQSQPGKSKEGGRDGFQRPAARNGPGQGQESWDAGQSARLGCCFCIVMTEEESQDKVKLR